MVTEEEQDRGPEEDWLAITPALVERDVAGILTKQRAELWALVLASRSVPCCIENAGGGRQLLVPPGSYRRALDELRLFEEEDRNWPPPGPPPRPWAENSLATLSVLLLLAVFHNLTLLQVPLPDGSAPDWTGLGTAQAARILDGQWWRLVTALTLHADVLHLISNLAIGGVFVYFLCRELGSGLAWSLLIASGALGNLANAFVQSPGHASVGASTAVFGAVGLLSAITLVRYRNHVRRRRALPVAAALALLALLGTEGKNTDLGAHLFGFLFGIVIGAATEYLLGTRGHPGRLLNGLLALVSAVAVVGAWWAALKLGG
jgi:membrane associated rhomboid family serine protease